MTMRRRQLLKTSAGLAAAGFLAPLPARGAVDALVKRARDAGEREVVVAGGTGAYGELVKRYFYDPFTAATGIRIVVAGGSYGEKLARLKAMNQVGKVEWDVVTLSADSLTPETTSMLRDLGTCADLSEIGRNGIAGACLKHGVVFDFGGGVLAYRSDAFPAAGRAPSGWADFWDVKTFPGPRALPNIGTPWWPLMAALLADGVAADRLFPLDLDRGFRKLDQIKPHVMVWWKSGDQMQQLFRSREVVMAMSFAGRALRLHHEGLPIGVAWNGAPLDASVWTVTKAAPHPNAALALLDFVYTRPEAHAAFAEESFGSTGHREALARLNPDKQRLQAAHPDNWSRIIRVDSAWLATHQEETLKRWAEWVSR
jgi:mannopine transport system substrate-binding protein